MVADIKWGSSCEAASKVPFEEQRTELGVTPVLTQQLNRKTALHLLHLQVRPHPSPHQGWQEHHREICIGTDLQEEKSYFESPKDTEQQYHLPILQDFHLVI